MSRFLRHTEERLALTLSDPRGREAGRDGGMDRGGGGCGVTGGETQEECEITATISSRYRRSVSSLLLQSANRRRGGGGGGGAENEEEERKWVLRVRTRCFPYECKSPQKKRN